jgi:putative acetyltransferase
LQNGTRSSVAAAALAVAVLNFGCKHDRAASGFVAVRADRQVTGNSKFPVAIDPNQVGTYPPEVKSGAGYFYDDVLEYRVWFHPEKGAKPLNGSQDYFVAFAQYEPAQTLSETAPGAEPPLVLVRQLQWIDEPKRGVFIPNKGDRITEWQVAWLVDSKRSNQSIEEFLKQPKEAGP